MSAQRVVTRVRLESRGSRLIALLICSLSCGFRLGSRNSFLNFRRLSAYLATSLFLLRFRATVLVFAMLASITPRRLAVSILPATTRASNEKLSGRRIRQQSQVACPFDLTGQQALVIGADSRESAGHELSILSQEPPEKVRVFVLDRASELRIGFKGTKLLSSEVSLRHLTLTSVHPVHPEGGRQFKKVMIPGTRQVNQMILGGPARRKVAFERLRSDREKKSLDSECLGIGTKKTCTIPFLGTWLSKSRLES